MEGSGQDQRRPPRPQSSGDWLTGLALSLVARSSLLESTIHELRRAFKGCEELRIMLAQGSSQAFDCFHIVAGGEVSSLPTATTVAVPSRTAVRQAMLEDRVMLIDESTPRREELEDWALFSLRDEASATGGCSWLMASPMSCGCSPQGSVKVLGAVVVSGCGSKACIDSAWLQHWSCSLGKTITRVSVQVMESTLDILKLAFPPVALRELLSQACKGRAQALLEALAKSETPAGSSTVSTPRSAATPGAFNAHSDLDEEAARQLSPFAAAAYFGAGSPGLAQAEPLSPPTSPRATVLGSPRAALALRLRSSLLRDAALGSSQGSLPGAVIRAASTQGSADGSLILDGDQGPCSSSSSEELCGYEDILQEAVTGMPAALEGRQEQAVHEVPDLLRLAISTQPADREAPKRRGRPAGTTASATK